MDIQKMRPNSDEASHKLQPLLAFLSVVGPKVELGVDQLPSDMALIGEVGK